MEISDLKSFLISKFLTETFNIFDCELCSRSPRNYFCDDDDDEGTFLKILLKLAKKGLIGLFV